MNKKYMILIPIIFTTIHLTPSAEKEQTLVVEALELAALVSTVPQQTPKITPKSNVLPLAQPKDPKTIEPETILPINSEIIEREETPEDIVAEQTPKITPKSNVFPLAQPKDPKTIEPETILPINPAIIEREETPEETETYLSLDDQIKNLQKNITNKQLIKSVNDLKSILYTMPQPADAQEQFKRNIEILYKQLFVKITQTKTLGKINPRFLKTNQILEKSLLDTLSLLWLRYIEIFGNENKSVSISFIATNGHVQINNFSPLKWAYYTAHAGKDKFTQNSILAHYSKPIIEQILQEISRDTENLIKYVTRKSKSTSHTPKEVEPQAAKDTTSAKNPVTAEDLAKYAYDKLTQYYILLFQPSNLILRPEFQDAFPITVRAHGWLLPELPKQIDQTLTDIAKVWFTLIEKNIISTKDKIQLPYPKIRDKATMLEIGITAEEWMQKTALAGYKGKAKNATYANFLRNQDQDNKEKNTTSVTNISSMLKNIPSETKNILTAATNWFTSEIDDDDTSEA